MLTLNICQTLNYINCIYLTTWTEFHFENIQAKTEKRVQSYKVACNILFIFGEKRNVNIMGTEYILGYFDHSWLVGWKTSDFILIWYLILWKIKDIWSDAIYIMLDKYNSISVYYKEKCIIKSKK